MTTIIKTRRRPPSIFISETTMKRLGITVLWTSLLLTQGCVSSLFYHPTAIRYQTPGDHRLPFEEVTFKSGDGTRLSGWFVPAAGQASGTVIHFHGNAQNMSAHFSFVDWLPREGFNLFVFDYRGYGRSEGKPGRRGVYQDGLAAISYAQSRKDVDPDKILILGQSLGGANALAIAGRKPLEGIRAIAVDSAFYSYRSIVRDKIREIPGLSVFRWPLSFLLITNTKSPGTVVDRISPVPLMIFHGDQDRVIPVRHGRALFQQAKAPKTLRVVTGGGHTEAFSKYRDNYAPEVLDFFRRALK